MKSLKMRSCSSVRGGTVKRLNSRIMKRPITIQRTRFFMRGFMPPYPPGSPGGPARASPGRGSKGEAYLTTPFSGLTTRARGRTAGSFLLAVLIQHGDVGEVAVVVHRIHPQRYRPDQQCRLQEQKLQHTQWGT